MRDGWDAWNTLPRSILAGFSTPVIASRDTWDVFGTRLRKISGACVYLSETGWINLRCGAVGSWDTWDAFLYSLGKSTTLSGWKACRRILGLGTRVGKRHTQVGLARL